MSRIHRIIFVFLFAITAQVFAGYDLPRPTGEHGVGTVRYHMIDKDRLDPYDQSLYRELMIQVWYPTATKSTTIKAHAQYLPDLMPHMKRMAMESFYVPQVVLDYLLVDIKCYAQENAPLLSRKQKYPVVILCHGLGSMVALHTAHAENLASHGYVVFGINHTFTCSLSIFPDGRIYPFKFNWNAPDKVKEYNCIINLWQKDVQFVLSQIENLAQDKVTGDEANQFYHQLDMNKLGMLGHSMGGATSTQMLRRDERVKAAVNMDGPLFGNDYEEGFKKPYMVMVAENSDKITNISMTQKELAAKYMTREEEDYLKLIFKFGIRNLCGNIRDLGADAYYVFFRGAGHNTFTDVPLVKDASVLLGFLEYFGLNTGTVSPVLAIDITNKLVVDFFNKYLMNKPALLLEDTRRNPFQEVVISR